MSTSNTNNNTLNQSIANLSELQTINEMIVDL